MVTDLNEGNDRHLKRTLASEASWKEFECSTTPRMTSVNVGTNITKVVGANGNRLSLLIINNSSSVVYLGYRTDLTSEFNIRLAPNGGVYSATVKNDGDLTVFPMWAYSSLADRKLTVVEAIGLARRSNANS